MPTCDRRHGRPAPRACSKERGFSYLLLLFMVLVTGAALAALGENVLVKQQREREAELLWRGGQIARALESYQAVPVNGRSHFPASLADLVADGRLADPRYHLRRLYLDPFTGRADWVLLRDSQGGILAVHSRSQQPALARLGTPAQRTSEPGDDAKATGRESVVRVSDWVFAAGGAGAPPP